MSAAVPASLTELVTATFGENEERARRYADTLCSIGIERGVIGPSEAPRIWERHVLNCAVVAEAFPMNARVIDVGSGAGLPGIPLALARPDLEVTLLDSLSRRVRFLNDVVTDLGLGKLSVIQARAEEHRKTYDVVTARAVASLARLGRWTARLVDRDGLLIALRGERAQAEIDADTAELRKAGWTNPYVRTYGDQSGISATIVRAVRR